MIDLESIVEMIGALFLVVGGGCLVLILVGLMALITGAVWLKAIDQFKGLWQKQRNRREGADG